MSGTWSSIARQRHRGGAYQGMLEMAVNDANVWVGADGGQHRPSDAVGLTEKLLSVQ